MTKPRFVVDPVPDLTGLDQDQKLEAFMAWSQRQFDRAHDWWPKDTEDRLQELETLNARLKGEWPIPALIGFKAEATKAEQLTETKIFLATLSAYGLGDDYDDFSGGLSGSVPGATSIIRAVSDGAGTVIVENIDSLHVTTDFSSFTTISTATLGFNAGSAILGTEYSDGKWITIGRPSGYGSIGFRVMQSTDGGLTWSNVYETTTDRTSSGPRAAASDGNGNWIISGYDSSTQDTHVFYSTDNGASWSKTGVIPNATTSSRRGEGARYGNGNWFIIGTTSSIWQSSDQTTYTLRSTIGTSFDQCVDLVYGGGIYVCVESSSLPELWTSVDGITWTNRGSFFTAGNGALCYSADIGWAFVSGVNFKKSSDGINWTTVSGTYGSLASVTEIVKTV